MFEIPLDKWGRRNYRAAGIPGYDDLVGVERSKASKRRLALEEAEKIAARILVADSEADGKRVRKFIRTYNTDFGWLEEVCQLCRLPPFWNGKALTLTIDHENGVDRDHRIENLRFLCPNCHAQTDTFTSKNIGKKGRFL